MMFHWECWLCTLPVVVFGSSTDCESALFHWQLLIVWLFALDALSLFSSFDSRDDVFLR